MGEETHWIALSGCRLEEGDAVQLSAAGAHGNTLQWVLRGGKLVGESLFDVELEPGESVEFGVSVLDMDLRGEAMGLTYVPPFRGVILSVLRDERGTGEIAQGTALILKPGAAVPVVNRNISRDPIAYAEATSAPEGREEIPEAVPIPEEEPAWPQTTFRGDAVPNVRQVFWTQCNFPLSTRVFFRKPRARVTRAWLQQALEDVRVATGEEGVAARCYAALRPVLARRYRPDRLGSRYFEFFSRQMMRTGAGDCEDAAFSVLAIVSAMREREGPEGPLWPYAPVGCLGLVTTKVATGGTREGDDQAWHMYVLLVDRRVLRGEPPQLEPFLLDGTLLICPYVCSACARMHQEPARFHHTYNAFRTTKVLGELRSEGVTGKAFEGAPQVYGVATHLFTEEGDVFEMHSQRGLGTAGPPWEHLQPGGAPLELRRLPPLSDAYLAYADRVLALEPPLPALQFPAPAVRGTPLPGLPLCIDKEACFVTPPAVP